MNNNSYRAGIISVTLFMAPAVYAEIQLNDSSLSAQNNKITIHRAKTTAKGRSKYYDVTITLQDDSAGVIQSAATVKSSPSTGIPAIVPGNYQSSDTTPISCTLTNMRLTNGRMQSFLTCPNFELSVASGKITTGHPYLNILRSAGISSPSAGVNPQLWGVVSNGYLTVDCNSYYYMANTPISIKTDGAVLVVSIYSNFTPSTLICSMLFNKI